jgi:hypothetical protein
VSGLSTALIIVLAIVALISLGGAAAFFNRVNVIDDFLNDTASITDVEDADNAAGATAALAIFSGIAVVVLLILWQYRLSKNAEALRGKLGLGPGWAIAGWLIPVANFFMGFLQLHQAAQASDPDLPPGAARESGRAPGVIALWAIAYVAGSVLFGVGRTIRPADSSFFDENAINDFKTADRLTMISFLAYLVAAVLGIVVVRTVTSRQQKAIAQAASGFSR